MYKPYFRQIFFLLFFLLHITGCDSSQRDLKYALRIADTNRSEIEKVLTCFKNDKLKLKAAQFLISNMVNEVNIDSLTVASNQTYFDEIKMNSLTNPQYNHAVRKAICDSILKIDTQPQPQIRYQPDLRTISSAFLIRHINESFETWKNNPWSKEIDFDTFCKFILPYKCGNDYWEGTFPYFRVKYEWLRDSFPDKSYIEVGRYIQSDIQKHFVQDNPLLVIHYPFLYPMRIYNVIHTNLGLCADMTALIVSALRSMGIPATECLLPYWGNSNDSHSWPEIIGDNPISLCKNEQFPYAKPEDEIISGMFWSKKILPSLSGIPSDVNIRYCRTIPKVYRKRYDIINRQLLESKADDIPPLFRNSKLEDISTKYLENSDVKIKIQSQKITQKNAYLCCYNPNTITWTPVAEGRIKNGFAEFKNMGKNVIYLPMIMVSGQLVPLSPPILIDANGESQILKANKQTLTKATLTLKVPFRYYIAYLFSLANNGRFQLANRSDMKDTVTVYTIRDLPYYDQVIDISGSTPSRYAIYNYYGIGSYMAELQFWGQDEQGKDVCFHGDLIGNPGKYGAENNKICDGDRVTYFDRSSDEIYYVGYDFKKPRKITQIRFVPRSDDNHVVKGRVYELFYWDDQWVSVGEQIGDENNAVTFDNIPLKALLRLHCVTTGKEHRIFICQRGKQVFF